MRRVHSCPPAIHASAGHRGAGPAGARGLVLAVPAGTALSASTRSSRCTLLAALAALVVTALVAVSAPGAASAGHLPVKGLVVPGQSIGGIGLGMTETAVAQRWGATHVVCTVCKVTTWLYEYPGSEPLGAAVEFGTTRKVVAIFTLGSPAGWGLKGAMMGDPVSNIYNLFGNPADVNCIGYDALTVRVGASMTSFYSASGTIYGYALTAASQPVCQ